MYYTFLSCEYQAIGLFIGQGYNFVDVIWEFRQEIGFDPFVVIDISDEVIDWDGFFQFFFECTSNVSEQVKRDDSIFEFD